MSTLIIDVLFLSDSIKQPPFSSKNEDFSRLNFRIIFLATIIHPTRITTVEF